MRKNDTFVAKIVITRLTKGFMAMFAPAESLPSPATLAHIRIVATLYIALDISDAKIKYI